MITSRILNVSCSCFGSIIQLADPVLIDQNKPGLAVQKTPVTTDSDMGHCPLSSWVKWEEAPIDKNACFFVQIERRRLHSQSLSRLAGFNNELGRNNSWYFNYPSATSSVIIMENPIITPIVAISECFSAWDSGISSSATT